MVAAGFVPLPQGIATMPAGAELGAALAGVDPARVAPGETAVLLAATRRQLSACEAVHAAALRECALADPTAEGGRRDEYGRHGTGEPRAVLGESRTRVANALDVAEAAFTRLPALGAAWAAGDLDGDRVRIFAQWTRALSDVHATEVVDTVLPEALLGAESPLILSGLIERISEVAAALDPTWAARLYDTAAAQARVRARRADTGTVNVSGLDLPVDEATRSVAHIALLAARAKAAGHPGGIDTIRARVYLLMLQPRTAGFDDDALIAHALATAPAAADGSDPHAQPGHADDAPPEPETASEPEREPEPDAEPEPTPTPGSVRLPRQARIELRVALSTLLGLDDKPARLPGHGILHAALARELASSHSRGQWRVSVAGDSPDGDNQLVASLLTRRRPHGHLPHDHAPGPPLGEGAPAAIVDLLVGETELAALNPAAYPAWAAVLTDLQTQLRQWQRARAEDTAARRAEHAAAEHAAEHEPQGDPGPELDRELLRRVAARRRARAREAMLRFPPAALRRWIEQRDRTCSFPPCRAAASRCEIDHSLAVVDGGITISTNLGPACTQDHHAKTVGAWTVHQHRPGRFTWTSPTGHPYPARTPRVLPELPAPLPPDQRGRSDPLPTEYADHGPLWHPQKPPPPQDTSTGAGNHYPDEPPF